MASSSVARAPAASQQPRGCPSDEQLLAFIPGQLAPADASSVTAHLETCANCQSRLTTLRQRSRPAVVEPTTPPKLPSPALPAKGGSDTPTSAIAEPRLRMPKRIGQYELIKQIGRGGMGLVYLALHLKLGRTVALKLLPGLHLSDKSAIIRLQREIAATGRMQHPNIVYATDANEEDGFDYLVMEHIEGVDVGRLVAILGPLPCPVACEIVRQAALGLAHIHSCGLVHRDLKPSNLMLDADGTVKILDLGLALLREGQQLGSDDSATQTGYLLGTADYVSPEQLHDPHDADVRSDLYSLGCTFYKLLTGKAPFSGSEHSSLAKKLDAHRFTTAQPIRELRPDVSAEVEAVLARLLAKQPGDRLQAPAELAELLAPLAAGANLAAVYVQTGVKSDLDDLPPPEPQATPIPPDASTQTQGKTPTPRAVLVPRSWPFWQKALAGAGAVALLAFAIWAVSNRGRGNIPVGGSPSVNPGGGTVTPPGTPPLPFPGLTVLPAEIPVPNSQGSSLQIDERLKEIFARADSMQLIRLGELKPSAGTISLDLEFVGDKGEAGLFFGYHEEVIVQGQAWGVGDFIYLAILPRATNEKFFALRHDTAQLRPGNRSLYATVEALQMHLPEGKDRKFHWEIDFTPAGLSAVRLNGQDQSQLLDTSYGKKFQPAGVFGMWGVYNNGATIQVFQPTLREHHGEHRQPVGNLLLHRGDRQRPG